ncbi:hypothetical protein [Paraburkholderia fungorum]|uniref:hypothetical protein n=1 Tax=Paraburkholderia fungorum TaxID=134537 RepID=UPI002093E492|nr:hypothetical protein [Paraburkholderia fungorum]USU21340.1 hypothetical protein NFE55_30080 [Paraburkholderia fungorum]USU26664.1 hypothetical protein NFS19_31485 [Paraburkholderia fungorum]
MNFVTTSLTSAPNDLVNLDNVTHFTSDGRKSVFTAHFIGGGSVSIGESSLPTPNESYVVVPNTDPSLLALYVYELDADGTVTKEQCTFPILAWRISPEYGNQIPVVAGGFQMDDSGDWKGWAILHTDGTCYPLEHDRLPCTREEFLAG